MTPAVLALEAAGVEHTIHEYQRDAYARGDDVNGFGREAAAALGLSPDRVFKTLIVAADGELVVAVLPVSCQLSMKRIAGAVGAKKASLADPTTAQRHTGYVVGGISPIGQRKPLRTVVDERAETFEQIHISAGRRGLEVSLAPGDLIALLDATVADITSRR